MISRRGFFATLGTLGATSVGVAAAAARTARPRDPLLPLWQAWKNVHVSSSGRVIDRLQHNVSHSEGQGYALLVAEALGDREGFETILDWTLSNLAVRPDDSLLAWRWDPADGGSVTDHNNASDGDLFVAWALLRAARRFGQPRWRDAGRAIAADLARRCLKPWPGRWDGTLLLIPGSVGFETERGYVVNPAYYMLRALNDLGEDAGEPKLARCAADGAGLLASLAEEKLVPDWTEVTEAGAGPATGKSAAFGYEAMRVPLYLVWSDRRDHPAVQRAREAYAKGLDRDAGQAPVVIEPASGRILETSRDPGYLALAALTLCTAEEGSARLMPAFAVGQPYYPGILHLLGLLAQRETALGCTL